jgi:hypothetical protein
LGCSCQIYGQQVVNPSSLLPVYTLPERRGGESAVFVIDVLELMSAGSLLITIEHKNSEDTTWGGAGSFGAINAAGVVAKHVSGMKEMYRWTLALGTGVAAGDSYRLQKTVSWLPY